MVFNIFGLYNMCMTYKKIKFENYVIISGIVEVIKFNDRLCYSSLLILLS